MLRRTAAYVALVEGGTPGERIRIKDAYPLVKEAVRKETDVDAKFRGMSAMPSHQPREGVRGPT